MNEKIKLLAEQAAKKHGHTIKFSTEITETLDSFAELIVRECANAIINDSRLNDVRSAANGCVRTIREHFGVE